MRIDGADQPRVASSGLLAFPLLKRGSSVLTGPVDDDPLHIMSGIEVHVTCGDAPGKAANNA